jgi:hypothetical protein
VGTGRLHNPRFIKGRKGLDPTGHFSGHSLLSRAFLFGALNAIVLFVFEFMLDRLFKKRNLWEKGAWLFLELLIGGTAIFLLFNFFWDWDEWSFKAYFLLLREYTSVMIIPVLIRTVLFYTQASPKQIQPTLLKFSSSNGKDQISIAPSDFLYLKSAGNYIEIHFLTEEGKKVKLIRNSLRVFEETYPENPHLKKCHRSYMVNPRQVKKVYRIKGKVEIDLGVEKLPLSPRYQEDFPF